jgi:shikimate dehydrogenase
LTLALRGSGGMAKAVASALRDGGYKNGLIVARNERAGRALAESLGYRWQAELGSERPQMLINVTPIGMSGPEADQLAFDAETIAAAETVFDVVAVPSETPLIVRARAEGKRVITGLEVIAIQALEQFVLYTGVRPTDEQFHNAVEFARSGHGYPAAQ